MDVREGRQSEVAGTDSKRVRLPGLLPYQSWQGQYRSSFWSVWIIARTGLGLLFRRKAFWAFYALSLLFFLMFFFGLYLLAYAEAEAQSGFMIFFDNFRKALKLDGSANTYHNFFRFQASVVVVVMALAGSVLVGNDFHHGSLPFYLSKPLGPWHYLLGKCLAIALFINLMTTIPAIILYVQYGMLTSWTYIIEKAHLLAGIALYGAILSSCLSLMLVALASWLRRTVPVIMVWTTMFFFLRQLVRALVDVLQYHPRWRLLDIWNDTLLLGRVSLGMEIPPRQPDYREAAVVLGAICLTCLIYLNRRIRAVEIVQ